MARLDLNALTLWITAAAQQQPQDLAAQVAERTGVSRATANKALRRLAEMAWLVREGSASRPLYRPGAMRQVVQRSSRCRMPCAAWCTTPSPNC
jgi:DNA-binding IclR family transcriptional regulator